MVLESCYNIFPGPAGQLACYTLESISSTCSSLSQSEASSVIKESVLIAFDHLERDYMTLPKVLSVALFGVLASRTPLHAAVGLTSSVAGMFHSDPRIHFFSVTLFSSIILGSVLWQKKVAPNP